MENKKEEELPVLQPLVNYYYPSLQNVAAGYSYPGYFVPSEVPNQSFSQKKSKLVIRINSNWHNKFEVPPRWRKSVERNEEYINESERNEINQMRKKLLLGPNDEKLTYYEQFFRYVLWMEEIGEEVMISRNNLNNVTMTLVKNSSDVKSKKKIGKKNDKEKENINESPAKNQTCFELKVQGLGENRPSIMKYDIVEISKHDGSDEITYEGKVIRILDEKIHIGCLNANFDKWLRGNSTIKLDIAFKPNSIRYIPMHKGLEYIHRKPELLKAVVLDPSETAINSKHHVYWDISSEEEVFNKEIFQNPEQKQAVRNIVNFTSGCFPYILVGPPGTGKTVTMVEAILQIKKKFCNSHILVCGCTNESCEMLTKKLIPWCTKDELIRVYSSAYSRNKIRDNVKEYSNLKDVEDESIPDNGSMQSYRILVTTLNASGRYLNKTPYFCPTHVFIDEAAQASEPQAVTAIALLSQSSFQIVLAGDPQQMSPYVLSEHAKMYGLDKSLLETMIKRNLYKDNHPDYITKLRLNYRSHPNVLHLPNELFYENQLKAVSEKALRDPIASIYVYHEMYRPKRPKTKNNDKVEDGYAATEFYSVISEETRNSNFSYYNQEEIDMVLQTVAALISLTKEKLNPPVNQNDIGIITPYSAQVLRIKESLTKEGFVDVEVGSPETFQGREKRIIIISTVRAKQNECPNDAKYNLGFIKVPQRFNVAVTRAMSKLIVIGCLNVLELDEKHWLQYIKYCVGHNSYFGPGIERFIEPK